MKLAEFKRWVAGLPDVPSATVWVGTESNRSPLACIRLLGGGSITLVSDEKDDTPQPCAGFCHVPHCMNPCKFKHGHEGVHVCGKPMGEGL